MSLVIFVEEASMAATLHELLPKIGIDPHEVQILTHQGKSDLDASWRLKLRTWHVPDTKFLILRDNDAGDCRALKKELLDVAVSCGKEAATKVRIVCQELEAWFLGDKPALVAAGYINPNSNPKELRNPEEHRKPSQILSRWKKERTKVMGAQEIAKHMDPNENSSPSFNHAIRSIKEMV